MTATERITAKIRAAMDTGVAQAASDFRDAVRAKLDQHDSRLSAGLQAAPQHEPPGRQSGALWRSIQIDKSFKGTPEKPGRLVGTNLIYARQKEYGGPIRAKNAKYLLIPLGEEGYRYIRNPGYSIKNDKDIRLIVRKGNLFLVRDVVKGQKLGKGMAKAKSAGMVFLFILKKVVYQHPRPYFRPAWEETAHARAATLRAAMVKGLQSVRAK